MLECQNCGATGDSFFSANYFGEMVCELCGTQSFLQARNETQDAEDMGMDVTTVLKTLKQRVVRRKKRDVHGNFVDKSSKEPLKKAPSQKTAPKLPELLDCIIATQMVLDGMARTLVKRIGSETFPAEEYPKAVKALWFKFLQTWGVKGTKPLLRCYNEFFMYYTREEEKSMDPAVTFDLLEQWDAEWEKKNEQEEERERYEDETVQEHDKDENKVTEPAIKRGRDKYIRTNVRLDGTLNKFSIVDMVGILMLASRVLNLGLLPSDFADWVATGVIPYHNALATTCADVPEVRDSVKFISRFFQSVMKRHRASTVQIAYSANHLMYHMGLRLPPLNVSLAVHRICATMGFPGEVFRNFQWISGFMNATGDQPEPPLLLQAEVDGYPRFNLTPTKEEKDKVDGILESEVGIVAHLVVAIKMCANWHEWIYERRDREEDDKETKSDGDERKCKAPSAAAVHNSHLLPRRDLDALAQFAREVFIDPDHSGIPECLQEHIEELQRIQTTDVSMAPDSGLSEKLKQNNLYAYPAIHVDGVLAESDEAIDKRMHLLRSEEAGTASVQNADGEPKYDAFFYPVTFLTSRRSHLHSATEHVLEMLCRKIDTPIASVLMRLANLDKRMQSLVYHFERTEYHVGLLQQGHEKWKAAQKAAKGHHVVRA
ncbi:hypothetical protein KXD40_002553 [Peronospora effusa]|uniref:GATA-type domain-containing protein n=1 Tax=Peronospora effusa TaxID=542832 RepID=A0A3R7Y094_9STRA|nr:hypothetical protein DD237_001320 [Peronospora effusa]UIZ26964.1 hypothetical protein KXD40_002553 [Peronospora effusa]